MIRADMIPEEVVKAAIKAWENNDQSFRPNAETIAAALNAWPFGAVCHYRIKDTEGWELVLPLPQEARDE